MGCSVSKSEFKKPIKYEYLKNDGTHRSGCSGKEFRSEGEKSADKMNYKFSYTEKNTDLNNQGPPSDVNSALPIK